MDLDQLNEAISTARHKLAGLENNDTYHTASDPFHKRLRDARDKLTRLLVERDHHEIY